MSRSVSLTTRQAVYAKETDEVFIILLKIEHDELDAPIQLSSDSVNTIRSGEDPYLAFPFDLSLPIDSPDKMPEATITIDNISREMVSEIRSISTAPTCTIMVVRASDPDTIEALWSSFEIKDIKYNSLVIQGTLSLENFLQEPYPADVFGPADFPGLF